VTRNGDETKGKGNVLPGIARDAVRAPLQKRFYEAVAVAEKDGGYAVTLDGRAVKTPAKRPLMAPTRGLADALAAEWEAQGAEIDPATMPLTRLLNSAIDGVADRREDVAAHIASFAANDLLCYRAEAPATLVRRQAEAWDPLLQWARESLGARFEVVTGMMPVEQPPASLAAIARAIAGLDALSLAALHVMTTITGSVVLALAHANGAVSLEEAWRCAIVDETWQSEQWGRDSEGEALLARRFADFAAASVCLRLLRSR
jgi:chaperone required for assembly of F1-ATPase